MSTIGYCMVCGEIGGHGNLPCPDLNDRPFPTFTIDNPSDYDARLDRIIELLEKLVARSGL